ncbi:MAG: hypothetical protein EXS30_03970 [Pedosphaera sp.]|nr:hypothetical protein [Pedosphaera sp.]
MSILLLWTDLAQAAPTITRFDPKNGLNGTKVEITGENIMTATLILFNGVPAKFEVQTATGVLVAIVPAGAVTGPIVVITREGNAVSSESFFVDSSLPNIETFTPEGKVGGIVVLALSVAVQVNRVSFHGTEATFIPIFERYLLVQVPSGAVSGPVSIEFDGGKAVSVGSFVVTSTPRNNEPLISSFSPSIGIGGEHILIRGFNLDKNPLAVLFGNAAAEFMSTPEGLLATVPAGGLSSSISVVTLWGVYTATDSSAVTRLPEIGRFEPTSGTIGSEVRVFGTNILNADEVTIGGIRVPFHVDPVSGMLVAKVPPGAVTGKIVVRTPNGTAVSGESIDIIKISRFTPIASVGGEIVVIVNSKEPVLGVEFNGVYSGFYQIRDGTNLLVVAKVPDGATSGPITLDLASFRVTSREAFQLSQVPVPELPKIFGMFPSTGLVGSQFTITGSNLTNLTLAVQVAGTLAEYFPSPDGLVVTVPSGAIQGAVKVMTLHGVAVAMDTFAVEPYKVRRNEPVCFAWDPNQEVRTMGYTLYVLDQRGSIFYEEKIPGKDSTTNCTSINFSSVPMPNGRYTALMKAYDDQGIESYPSGRILLEVVPYLDTISRDVGSAGESVLITGKGLDDVTGISFGGVAAEYRVVDPETVEVMIPVGASSGPLVAMTSTGGLLAVSEFYITADFDLALTLNPESETVVQGRDFSYEYVILNIGPDTALDINTFLSLSVGMDIVSLKINGLETVPVGLESSLHFDSIGGGESIVVSAIFRGKWVGDGFISAAVRASPADVNQKNNVLNSRVAIFPEIRVSHRPGNEIEITWDSIQNEFALQFSKDLGSEENWRSIPGVVISNIDSRSALVLPLSEQAGFFRLQRQ